VSPDCAFDANAVRQALQTRWLGRALRFLAETDSTNRIAAEWAAAGAPHGAAVIADAQRAGRGRHGRSFFSPAGRNLYTSLVLRGQALPLQPTLVLAAGAAAAQTLAQALGDAQRVALKWPNDVLLGGRKSAGILMELGGGGDFGILGIGVNLNLAPQEWPESLRGLATSLRAESGAVVQRAAFAAALYGNLEAMLDLHNRAGFAGVRPAFERFFRQQGAQVRVADLAGAVVAEGRVRGVAGDGALRIATAEGGEARVLAGDVHLLREGAAERRAP